MKQSTFEEGLHDVVRKIKKKHVSANWRYSRDAVGIRDHVISMMKRHDAFFRFAFRGAKLTGSYLDRLRIGPPRNIDIDIILDLGVHLKPIKDPLRPGLMFLKASGKHFLVDSNDMVDRIELQKWLGNILSRVISKSGYYCHGLESGHLYHVTYDSRARDCGESVAHVITATNIYNDNVISLDFMPAFQFKPRDWPIPFIFISPWFVVPFEREPTLPNNRNTFMICSPNWHTDSNMKDSLVLMQALGDAANMTKLSNSILKSVYLLALQSDDEYDSNDEWNSEEAETPMSECWKRPRGEILIRILQNLIDYMGKGQLPFYLASAVNCLKQFDDDELQAHREVLTGLLTELKEYQTSDCVDERLHGMFGC